MTIPLARKIDGKKFMWDGGTYETPEAAHQAMEDYIKDGFEAQMVEGDGHYLVYSRRVAAVQAAE